MPFPPPISNVLRFALATGWALFWMSGRATSAEPTPTRAVPISFENDVVPILTRFGCNAGACHGKARGQNGFQLSLLGFDADFDFNAIAQEARGRRVFPASPENSLLLR